MAKRPLAVKLGLELLMSLILLMPAQEALAREGRKPGSGRHHEIVAVKHKTYRYYDGRFYWPTFFNFGLFVVRPPFGAVVTVLPSRHKTLVFSGITYYYYDDIYYRASPGGYMVVPQPVPYPNVSPGAERITINVPNARGRFTPVTLARYGDGYLGPQGEYYPGHPTVEQLKALYGS
ncbi:MAG: DUF6515 family protein [Candidatus Omnitrophota bacterium]